MTTNSVYGSPESVLKVIADWGQEQMEAEERYEFLCDQAWNKMSPEEQMMAFYSVCKRIHKGDVVEKGSYRHVLYSTFEFPMDAYGIGMQCGYMAIHNAIVDIDEFEQLRKENNEMRKQLNLLKDDLK